MYSMQTARFYCQLIWSVWCVLQVTADYVKLSHDGPVVLGGTITFRADLYGDDGERPRGTFRYKWRDNSLIKHEHKTEGTTNTTTSWSLSYSRQDNVPGRYIVQVEVEYRILPYFWSQDTSARTEFEISECLNGNITMEQGNVTTEEYISSVNETKLMINMRKGDYNFIMKNATSITTYWFVDCKYYGQTNDFTFAYNFTSPNTTHEVGALVVASYIPPTTTTIMPPTTTTPTTVPANVTTNPVTPNITTTTSSNGTVTPVTTTASLATVTTVKPTTVKPITTTASPANASAIDAANMSLPYICSNASLIPPDPNNTYGYFQKKIYVRAPISNISVDGTNWIQPWDMLNLNVTCKGSGPFRKCLQFHRGKYNVTGNETCDNTDHLHTCNFSIIHYFLEPSVYTILIVLNNEVSTQIYPLTINIYKVTTKPQLSVIVVPVSCTLVAVVLIVFGVAYYIQSRARFTVEVADFDFGQNNPEMEYKTFAERLRDSFNNTGYKPLSNPQTHQ